jgi:hypothetical protein
MTVGVHNRARRNVSPWRAFERDWLFYTPGDSPPECHCGAAAEVRAPGWDLKGPAARSHSAALVPALPGPG